MIEHTATRRPRQPIERTTIDERYTYIFDNGRVDLLRNGKSWIQDAPLSKAWIAAANEIERLRTELRVTQSDLEVALDELNAAKQDSLRLEAAEHALENQGMYWEEEEGWYA